LIAMLLAGALAQSAAPSVSPSPSPGRELDVGFRRPAWLPLRESLRTGQYAALTNALEEAQRAFEASVLDEDRARSAFRAFAHPDAALEAPLSAWIAAAPRSWAARAARAFHYAAMGRAARGQNWAAETPDAQFKEMSAYFDRAVRDCRDALWMRPRLLACQILLIDVFKTGASTAAAEGFAREALRAEPRSFLVRQAYMHALTPRWGGSYARMERLARDSQRYVAVNPRMKQLMGYVAWDRGSLLVVDNRPAEAIPLFDEALAWGDDPHFRAERGGAYLRLKQYRLAQADLKKAVDVAPDGWSYGGVSLQKAIVYLASYFYQHGRPDGAQALVRRAEEIDPLDPEVIEWREFLFPPSTKPVSRPR
jgi:tetratricopeptide (TPR) repeat protein